MNARRDQTATSGNSEFFIVAREPGHMVSDLPTWGSSDTGSIQFSADPETPIEYKDVPDVPGAFQLLNVLSDSECDRFVEIGEALGFHSDAPVSLPRSVRHNHNRYSEGDFFKPHTDGAWPGTRIVNNRLVQDAYGDRYSQMTFLIFLSGGYEGGRTLFHTGPSTVPGVATPKGAILAFPHGMHPQHCVHAGEEITKGV